MAVVHKDGRKGVYRQLKEPIREVDRARFKRELDVLSRQVRHRSIVSLYEWDGEAQRPWYISELGGSFKDWWQRAKKELRDDQVDLVHRAVSVVEELASALAACHQEGVVHRDVKTANVVVKTDVEEPWPILIDFGIAHNEDGQRLTQTGDAVGNARFSPDEMRDRLPEVLPWLDLFGLAQMLIWMLDTKASKQHWQRPVHWRYARYGAEVPPDLELSVRAFTGACSNPDTSPADGEEALALLRSLFPPRRSQSASRIDTNAITEATARGAAGRRIAEARVQEEIDGSSALAEKVYGALRSTVLTLLGGLGPDVQTAVMCDKAFHYQQLGATDLLWVTAGAPSIHFRIKVKVVPRTEPPKADTPRSAHLAFWRKHMPQEAIPFTFALEGGVVEARNTSLLDGRWITILKDGTLTVHPLSAAFGGYSDNDLGGSAKGPGTPGTLEDVQRFVESVLTNETYWEYIGGA